MGEGGVGWGGVFDPEIHLAFMVWRRLNRPLNFVFRWREPERWEGDCGAGVEFPPHLGGTCVRTENREWVTLCVGVPGSATIDSSILQFLLTLSRLLLMQVTIEVVDGLEGHEPEKGLRKETKPNWASPNWRNWWPHTSSSSSSSSSSSTHQTEENERSYGSNTEDSNFLRPPADWDRRGSKAQTEYGEDYSVCVFTGKFTHAAQYLAASYSSTSPRRFNTWLLSDVESVICRFADLSCHHNKCSHPRRAFGSPWLKPLTLFYEMDSSVLWSSLCDTVWTPRYIKVREQEPGQRRR